MIDENKVKQLINLTRELAEEIEEFLNKPVEDANLKQNNNILKQEFEVIKKGICDLASQTVGPIIKTKVDVSLESSYRRGYIHGYNAALRDRDLVPASIADKFLDEELQKWRYEKHGGASKTPPDLLS